MTEKAAQQIASARTVTMKRWLNEPGSHVYAEEVVDNFASVSLALLRFCTGTGVKTINQVQLLSLWLPHVKFLTQAETCFKLVHGNTQGECTAFANATELFMFTGLMCQAIC